MIIRCSVVRVLLFFLLLLSVNELVGQGNSGEIRCICLDAGHGGPDPGAVGAISSEKNITLSVVLKLGKLIKENYPGIKVVYTREKDVGVDVYKRGQIANDYKADLFISFHTNSYETKSPHGIETYVLGLDRSEENLRVAMKENASIKYEKDHSEKYAGFDPTKPESYIVFSLLQNVHLKSSLKFAGLVQEALVSNTKKTDRGVRQAGYLVLKDAVMPAILVEACFISHPEEERYLNTQAGQNKIAASIFSAFGKYKSNVEKNSASLADRSKETVAEEVEGKVGAVEKKKIEGTLLYAVQVASAVTPIKNLTKFGLPAKAKMLKSGGRYKYYIGESKDYSVVNKEFVKMKRKIRDCFIIGLYDGKIISVAEAKKIKQK